MSGQTINMGVLQDATRDLLDLLQRIHSLEREHLLPADVVEGFTVQMGTMLSNISANCVLRASGCDVTLPPDWNREGASKKMK